MRTQFLIAGAQRSGTTLLYSLLGQHPEIYLAKPIKPEPKFFCTDSEYNKGREYYLDKYFKDVVESDYKVFGEKSTSYMTHNETPLRIKSLFPNIKLIFILRNPIERAISNYWFSEQNKLEVNTFEYAIKNEENRIKQFPMEQFSDHPFAYLRRGKYIDYLKIYLKYFYLSQIHIVIHDELVNNTNNVMNDLYSFLGVKEIEIANVTKNKVNSVERKEDVLTKDLKEYLLNYFNSSIEELEKVIHKDLSVWKK